MKEAQTTQEALNAALKEAQAWKVAALAVNAERDALAAKIAVIKNAKTIGELIAAINATPQQHLAEIRAEAGRAGYAQALFDQFGGDYGALYELSDKPDQYAETIRQGGEK